MIELLIFLALLALGVPITLFVLECLLGLVARKAQTEHAPPTPTTPIRAKLLMPAHNEASVIGKTLSELAPHLTEFDELIVIADNCSDNTAEIVRAQGFKVIERQHDTDRGKGFALDFGLQHIKRCEDDIPEVVVIVDADCFLKPHALAWLKYQAFTTQRTAQAKYLMLRGSVERIPVKISEFAFKVKNQIRLKGLDVLGLPVPLTGTGMAFPWQAIAEAQLATGDIVEDMRLGVELAERGEGARYCEQAMVYSYFPQSEAAEKTQRERWEHGHLNTLKTFVPRLFKRALQHQSPTALGMMVDLLIPPLSLLVLLLGGSAILLTMGALVFGTWGLASLAWIYLSALLFVIVLVWHYHGQDILSAEECMHIPFYVLSKIAVYISYMVRKQTKWIRTERDS